MSIILELRKHLLHAGIQLVHPASEDVLLANVFGVVKNLPAIHVLAPWLTAITGLTLSDDGWAISFWERQPRPEFREGSTIVDIVLSSDDAIVFVEVKLDAPASLGTTQNPDRNQLIRNLDVGYHRASRVGKRFALIFLTANREEPGLVGLVRTGNGPFPINSGVAAAEITSCLYWASWASVGDVVAAAYAGGKFSVSEGRFALDLLAYLAIRKFWENSLGDETAFYSDKLYRPLQRTDTPFVAYASQKPERDQSWRTNAWDEQKLRKLLLTLRMEDKALLKMLAENGGAMRQDAIMEQFPTLRGKTSASLRALKSHVNSECRGSSSAPLLSIGTGSGSTRRHEINPQLGMLRDLVISIALTFDVDWRLLDLGSSHNTQD